MAEDKVKVNGVEASRRYGNTPQRFRFYSLFGAAHASTIDVTV